MFLSHYFSTIHYFVIVIPGPPLYILGQMFRRLKINKYSYEPPIETTFCRLAIHEHFEIKSLYEYQPCLYYLSNKSHRFSSPGHRRLLSKVVNNSVNLHKILNQSPKRFKTTKTVNGLLEEYFDCKTECLCYAEIHFIQEMDKLHDLS